jgi:beta-lactamase class A
MPPRRHRSQSQHRVLVWAREHHDFARRALIVCAIGIGLLTLFQLIYPAGRLLPFVEVSGYSLGGQTANSVSKVLGQKYSKATIAVTTDERTFTSPLDEAGIDVEFGAAARAAARYPLGQRFIPLSSLFIMAFRNTPMPAQLDADRVQYFAQQISKDSYIPAVNASVAVKDGQVSLVSAKPSRTYDTKKITAGLERLRFTPETKLRIKPLVQEADRNDKEVRQVLGEAQKTVDTPVVLNLEGEKITVSKAVVGTWLDFPEDAKTKRLTLSIKPAAVKQYLITIQSKAYKAPGKTTVQTLDGQETQRQVGAAGRGIDLDKTVALLQQSITKHDRDVVPVPVTRLDPTVVYDRQYTNSTAGLNALLADLAAGKGGYGIAVAEANGRSGAANGSKQFVAASTFKLYVAYAVFKKIESSELHWSDEIYNGQNVEVCFDLMIVKSDNNCAKALATKITWQGVQNLVRSIGVSGNTTLTTPELYTTANDLALMLTKLQNGTLVSAADQARWIDAMKRQIYRAGIPAGTGVPVADKVGFLDGYLHDAAIVYGPKGPYVMVIMTQGSSWGQMADAARQIHAQLNR